MFSAARLQYWHRWPSRAKTARRDSGTRLRWGTRTKWLSRITEGTGSCARSERAELPVPSVIRLNHFVRVPHRNRVPLSRRAVFARDGHRCQYCNRAAENIDHVVPRSRGGTHAWDNVVASCRACNSRKEDRLLSEVDLRLTRLPREPQANLWIMASAGSIDPAWEPFLPA